MQVLLSLNVPWHTEKAEENMGLSTEHPQTVINRGPTGPGSTHMKSENPWLIPEDIK